MDQTREAMPAVLEIRFSDESIQQTLDSRVLGRRKRSDGNKLAHSRAMNQCIVRVFVIRVMILRMRGSFRAVMLIWRKCDLLAVRPRRSYAGEKHEKRASDDQQAFHADVKTLPCHETFFKLPPFLFSRELASYGYPSAAIRWFCCKG